MENFRDRSSPDAVPDAPRDARTDAAADRADAPAIRFADGSRVRRADLEISPDTKPPPGAEDRQEAYLREYKKQLGAADTSEVRLPDELEGLRATGDQEPAADRPKSAQDRPAGDDKPDRPDEVAERVDRPESNDPYARGWKPTEYRPDALDGPDGARVPLRDGPPKRDDTAQGRYGDCGVIATLGAVAGTKPDKIGDAITQNPDGTYAVRLFSTTSSFPDGLTKPGEPRTYTVTPNLPVRIEDGTLAGAKAEKVAWPAIMEKAIAGSDQTWTPEQWQAYADRWEAQKDARNRRLIADGKEPLPDGPVPSGYVRLNQGTDAYDRADLLTAITGRQAEVRTIPADDKELIKSFFADKLAYDKPILVGTRPYDRAANERYFPHKLAASHVYEVTGLTSDGRIELRNPWNHRHPDPMTPAEFREYFQQKKPDGSRVGRYSTLS